MIWDSKTKQRINDPDCWVSNCCGAEPKFYTGPHGTPDNDSRDHGICPDCGDHCNYIKLSEFENIGGNIL